MTNLIEILHRMDPSNGMTTFESAMGDGFLSDFSVKELEHNSNGVSEAMQM